MVTSTTAGARGCSTARPTREGTRAPYIIAHRNVLQRFQRYDATRELNSLIMGRQFNKPDYVFPGEHRRPDQVYDDELTVSVGGVRLDLSHGAWRNRRCDLRLAARAESADQR